MSKHAPVASPNFVETSDWNYGIAEYLTEPFGRLTVGEGDVKLLYRLDLDYGSNPERGADALYNVACFHRLADATGAVWEARTCFRPHLFVQRMLDLSSLEWPLWAHHAPDRVAAIEARPLITGLYAMKDDRFYRRFWVDDALLEIQFKYQSLTIDIGNEGGDRVAVRLSGFFGSWAHVPLHDECCVPLWKGGTIRIPVAGREHEDYDPDAVDDLEGERTEVPGGWLTNLSPITYSLWAKEFLFRNDATWDREYPTHAVFPRPIVFRRVEGATGEPQPNVTFRPA